jgi:glyoxylase-like metal-dependent hydrolase (beta-lactamase superfamily II)
MRIKTFTSGPYSTNSYVVYNDEDAILIDAPLHAAKNISNFLGQDKLSLKCIILTHVHWDHVEDAEKLKAFTNAKIGIHRMDEENQEEINSIFEGEAGKIKSDFSLEEGRIISAGSISFKIFHTPGHTPGSVCLYNEKEKILFSGDTLFAGTYGRVDFQLGDANDMKESLKKLSKLPEAVKVFPGHGPETTLGKEEWIKNQY